MNCASCRWFEAKGTNNMGFEYTNGLGRCRCRAPKCYPCVDNEGDAMGFTTPWPTVEESDWCGEFEQSFVGND